MKTFNDMELGSRFIIYHVVYEKKSSRTAYMLDYNHFIHDYDYMPGSEWFYMGMRDPAKLIESGGKAK